MLPEGRKARIALLAFLVIGLVIVIFRLPNACLSDKCSVSSSKVLIIDQLAVDAPNATFRENVESIFSAAKVSYDVVNGTDVTVDFYRALPSKGYKLILIRSHSGLLFPRDPKNPVYLFTGELYSTSKHAPEVLSGALTPCQVTVVAPIYFCIAPLFVSRYMNGTFPGTVLLLNGCDTLINSHLADAFLSRGAFGFTGWDEFVTATHMDAALNHFVVDFVDRSMTLAQSVQDTVEKFGPDPYYRGNFKLYPESAGSIKLLDLLSSSRPTSTSIVSSESAVGLWVLSTHSFGRRLALADSVSGRLSMSDLS